MLTGEYHYNLDDKGRLFLPAELRKNLSETVVISRGLDECLFVFPEDIWNDVEAKVSGLSFTKKANREFSRFLLSAAFKKKIDAAGRVNLEQILIDYATINKACVIIGVGKRLEIWSEEAWKAQEEARKASFESISEEIELDL